MSFKITSLLDRPLILDVTLQKGIFRLGIQLVFLNVNENYREFLIEDKLTGDT